MAQNNIPFTRGKNVQMKLYNDGNPVIINAKNWSVEQNAVEVADDVNGEIRSRLDLVTNYFQGTVDIYESDEAVMNEIMKQQANDDAFAAPLQQSASIRKRHNDGSKAAYRCKNMKWGPWTSAAPGRTEANMLTLKFRFTDWEQV